MIDGLVVAVSLAAVLGSLVFGFRYVNGARPRGQPIGRAESDGDAETTGAGGARGATPSDGGMRRCGHCGETNGDVATFVYCRSCLGRIR